MRASKVSQQRYFKLINKIPWNYGLATCSISY